MTATTGSSAPGATTGATSTLNRSYPVPATASGWRRIASSPTAGGSRCGAPTTTAIGPAERPYFRAAAASRDVALDRAVRVLRRAAALGITCAVPLFDGRPASTLGVFTVDFSLDRLAGALEELEVSPAGACSSPRGRARC